MPQQRRAISSSHSKVGDAFHELAATGLLDHLGQTRQGRETAPQRSLAPAGEADGRHQDQGRPGSERGCEPGECRRDQGQARKRPEQP
ncbi:MAG: hypothetical protein MZV65_08405 [Chromatiales bacterium]|nr:hypothetical protein [Chromatiales bacterium]